jgi:hypothetical protein
MVTTCSSWLFDGKEDGVSHSEIRNVLLKYNVRWRHSKTMLGGSRDPEYELKKSVLKS